MILNFLNKEHTLFHFVTLLKCKIMKKDKPMCQCGNTSNENGYCDGSHNK